MEHSFTTIIKEILVKHFQKASVDIFDSSQLLQYINIKTRSVNKGAKARGSFANLFALYVVIEDYLIKGYDEKEDYSEYSGAEFTNLFQRQRELPFGAKLQNHALNNRMNAEFQKFFPTFECVPILRNLETTRYWINERLIKISISGETYNLSKAIIEIIEEYIKIKKEKFEQFIQICSSLKDIYSIESIEAEKFILSLLAPNVDARLFEIISYSILKYYYHNQKIYWGFEGYDLFLM